MTWAYTGSGPRGADTATMVDQIRQRLAGEPNRADAHEILAEIERTHSVFGSHTLEQTSRDAQREILGAGKLQPLLDDPDVTDVLVNGPNDVWIDRGYGLERTTVDLGQQEELRTFAVRLAAQCGVRLDDSKPVADGRLPDGTRFHGLLSPLCESAAVISLRTFRRQPLTLGDLTQSGSLHPEWIPVLEALIACQANFLISGATGSGKTTLLAALLALVPETERIISIEESRELNIAHQHILALQTKPPNVEGVGETTQSDLVRYALRMRPDRIVVGECRGAELREMLAALNTGHRGGCGTIHANSAHDVPARLAAMASLGGMDSRALSLQVQSAIDVVIHVSTFTNSHGATQRYIQELAVLETDSQANLIINSALKWVGRASVDRSSIDQAGVDRASLDRSSVERTSTVRGPAYHRLCELLGVPSC